MDDIHSFRIFNKLKSVYRYASVDDRHESTAEHSWSSLVLADFFLNQMNGKGKINIDRLKVYELLMYHDIVEIEAGDTTLHPDKTSLKLSQKDREKKAFDTLKEKFPPSMKTKIVGLVTEFTEQKTVESRFARAVDMLDAEVHELDYKKDWKGWTKDFLIEKKMKYFLDFPEMKKVFEEMVEYEEKNGFFDR